MTKLSDVCTYADYRRASQSIWKQIASVENEIEREKRIGEIDRRVADLNKMRNLAETLVNLQDDDQALTRHIRNIQDSCKHSGSKHKNKSQYLVCDICNAEKIADTWFKERWSF